MPPAGPKIAPAVIVSGIAGTATICFVWRFVWVGGV
jgi:hypothetical protein